MQPEAFRSHTHDTLPPQSDLPAAKQNLLLVSACPLHIDDTSSHGLSHACICSVLPEALSPNRCRQSIYCKHPTANRARGMTRPQPQAGERTAIGRAIPQPWAEQNHSHRQGTTTAIGRAKAQPQAGRNHSHRQTNTRGRGRAKP